MRCARVLDLLSAYIDGELDRHKRSQVLSHLDSCDPCRGELELLRELSGDIARLEAADAPLGDGWSATLAARAAMADEEIDSMQGRGLLLSPYASMAAALLIGIFAGVLASRMMPVGSDRDPASTEEVARRDGPVYANEPGSSQPASQLQDYDSSGLRNVSFERTAALRRAGALAYDTFLVSQDAKAATLLPGATDHERLQFLDRELELLRLRHRAGELARAPAVDSQVWQVAVRLAEGVEEIASTLESRDRAMASPSAVLIDLSERAGDLLELAAGVAASLGTACGLDELDSRCNEPSYRTVALATMARRNALSGNESVVRDQLRQLREILGAQDPYLQRLEGFWVPIARARAGYDFEDALREILDSFEKRELALPEFRVFFGAMQTGGTFQLEIHGTISRDGGLLLTVPGTTPDDQAPSGDDGDR